MQLNQRLNIKHSQSIVMTPQLRQAIKLLQFSNLELSSYIEEEIEKNPFLENKKNDLLARSDNSKLQKTNNNESFTDDNDKDNQRWEEKFHNKQRGNSFDEVPTATNEASLLLSISSSFSSDKFNSDRTQLGVPTKHLSPSSKAETPKPGDVFTSERFL